jgi:adenylylsulfate kinase-like enzyme
MIYWLTGQPSLGKSSLAKKIHQLISTEKRNWRKDVFLVDETILDTISSDKSDKTIHGQIIAEYLHKNGCDVVVDLFSPNKEVRDSFKDKIGKDKIQEFYCYSSSVKSEDYQEPIEDFVSVDTTKDTPNQAFNKIIHHLVDTNKL